MRKSFCPLCLLFTSLLIAQNQKRNLSYYLPTDVNPTTPLFQPQKAS